MIVEYQRPVTIEEALRLLKRQQPITVPLGGGTAIKQQITDPVAVVDLQMLGLDTISQAGNYLELGAMVTLQALLEVPELPEAAKKAIVHEASYNLRQAATVAGTLVAAGGRSPFATLALSMDANLILLPGEDRQVSLGSLLALPEETLNGGLITQVKLPLHGKAAYEYVARTPADKPVVCAAAFQWASGRTRLALGGYGKAPLLVFDGPEPAGVVDAARDAYSRAGDEWASAEYRQEVAGVLAERCLGLLNNE